MYNVPADYPYVLYLFVSISNLSLSPNIVYVSLKMILCNVCGHFLCLNLLHNVRSTKYEGGQGKSQFQGSQMVLYNLI